MSNNPLLEMLRKHGALKNTEYKVLEITKPIETEEEFKKFQDELVKNIIIPQPDKEKQNEQ